MPLDHLHRLASRAHTIARFVTSPRRIRSAEQPRLRYVYQEIGATTRYRVWHAIEQATIAGLQAEAIDLDKQAKQLFDLRNVDVLLMHRITDGLDTRLLALAAQRRAIPVIYDTDDLIWDEREHEYNSYDHHYTPATIALLLKQIKHNRLMMTRADAIVCSTQTLASFASASFARPTYVLPNVLSAEQVKQSARARSNRITPAHPIIGYFSGTITHSEDLESIAEALVNTFARYPTAQLWIYGAIKLRGSLADLARAGRVIHRPAVDWRDLPAEIAAVTVNIAPLVDNPQRRAKSAIKFYEAAAVEVPTVASALPPYTDAIDHRRTGLICATSEDWSAALDALLNDPSLRLHIAREAAAAIATQTTMHQAGAFGSLMQQLVVL